MDALSLTPRQKDVLTELRAGKSNKEIARTLDIAESTVKIHLTEIFKQLGVTTRYQALTKDYAVKIPEAVSNITDLDILKTFANTMMGLGNETWSVRIVEFGRSVIKLEKNT